MPIIFVDMSLPKPSGEFEWVQESWGAALRCRPLAAVARHCFSTRELELEGVRADGMTRWQDLANALGVELDSLVRMRQVHCADVFEVRKETGQPENPSRPLRTTTGPKPISPSADDPAVAVSVRAADCVPILLADRRTGAVAAIHAGWKGTAAGAAIVAVQSLTSRFGTNPEDVIAAVGPSIGPCCYEVGPDLASHFSSHAQASAMVHAGCEAASRSVARDARPARGRGRSAAADSRVRAVHLRPSRAVPFIPARWEECGQARGGD